MKRNAAVFWRGEKIETKSVENRCEIATGGSEDINMGSQRKNSVTNDAHEIDQ